MNIIFVLLSATMILSGSQAVAKEATNLPNVLRPEFTFSQSRMAKTPASEVADKKTDNSRFAGSFRGQVTVHYLKKMIQTPAAITISSDIADIDKSHYDFYVIPVEESYLEIEWQLDQTAVKRSVTISGNTLYITDIIDYQGSGGNSQIRTLIFNQNNSALTFLKTEFDDAIPNPATGQIIGRFTRVE